MVSTPRCFRLVCFLIYMAFYTQRLVLFCCSVSTMPDRFSSPRTSCPSFTCIGPMFGRGLLPVISASFESQKMKSWPRKFIRDAAYLFLPFAFVAFLILLGGALLVTWGDLSNAVLIGFCVTAGLLVGFFLLCHLVLYCSTWAAKFRADPEGSPTVSCSASARRATTSDGPPPAERTSRMVCADCHGRRLERDGSPPRNDAGRSGDIDNQGVC